MLHSATFNIKTFRGVIKISCKWMFSLVNYLFCYGTKFRQGNATPLSRSICSTRWHFYFTKYVTTSRTTILVSTLQFPNQSFLILLSSRPVCGPKVCRQALVKRSYVCDKNMEFRTPQKDLLVQVPTTMVVFTSYRSYLLYFSLSTTQRDPKKVTYVLIDTLGTIYLV